MSLARDWQKRDKVMLRCKKLDQLFDEGHQKIVSENLSMIQGLPETADVIDVSGKNGDFTVLRVGKKPINLEIPKLDECMYDKCEL